MSGNGNGSANEGEKGRGKNDNANDNNANNNSNSSNNNNDSNLNAKVVEGKESDGSKQKEAESGTAKRKEHRIGLFSSAQSEPFAQEISTDLSKAASKVHSQQSGLSEAHSNAYSSVTASSSSSTSSSGLSAASTSASYALSSSSSSSSSLSTSTSSSSSASSSSSSESDYASFSSSNSVIAQPSAASAYLSSGSTAIDLLTSFSPSTHPVSFIASGSSSPALSFASSDKTLSPASSYLTSTSPTYSLDTHHSLHSRSRNERGHRGHHNREYEIEGSGDEKEGGGGRGRGGEYDEDEDEEEEDDDETESSDDVSVLDDRDLTSEGGSRSGRRRGYRRSRQVSLGAEKERMKRETLASSSSSSSISSASDSVPFSSSSSLPFTSLSSSTVSGKSKAEENVQKEKKQENANDDKSKLDATNKRKKKTKPSASLPANVPSLFPPSGYSHQIKIADIEREEDGGAIADAVAKAVHAADASGVSGHSSGMTHKSQRHSDKRGRDKRRSSDPVMGYRRTISESRADADAKRWSGQEANAHSKSRDRNGMLEGRSQSMQPPAVKQTALTNTASAAISSSGSLMSSSQGSFLQSGSVSPPASVTPDSMFYSYGDDSDASSYSRHRPDVRSSNLRSGPSSVSSFITSDYESFRQNYDVHSTASVDFIPTSHTSQSEGSSLHDSGSRHSRSHSLASKPRRRSSSSQHQSPPSSPHSSSSMGSYEYYSPSSPRSVSSFSSRRTGSSSLSELMPSQPHRQPSAVYEAPGVSEKSAFAESDVSQENALSSEKSSMINLSVSDTRPTSASSLTTRSHRVLRNGSIESNTSYANPKTLGMAQSYDRMPHSSSSASLSAGKSRTRGTDSSAINSQAYRQEDMKRHTARNRIGAHLHPQKRFDLSIGLAATLSNRHRSFPLSVARARKEQRRHSTNHAGFIKAASKADMPSTFLSSNGQFQKRGENESDSDFSSDDASLYDQDSLQLDMMDSPNFYPQSPSFISGTDANEGSNGAAETDSLTDSSSGANERDSMKATDSYRFDDGDENDLENESEASVFHADSPDFQRTSSASTSNSMNRVSSYKELPSTHFGELSLTEGVPGDIAENVNFKP